MMYDDPNSLSGSRVRANRDRKYARWLKQERYADVLEDYLKNRCVAPIIWEAFRGLVNAREREGA